MKRKVFFTKMNIHVIQCDEKIQSDHIISSAEELADYMEHMEILGGGGTDFRPAFQYVDSLIQSGKVQQAAGTSLFYGRIWDVSP